MTLVTLSEANLNKAYELYMSFNKEENGFTNEAYGLNLEEFKDFVESKRKRSLGLDLPLGYVPDTTYLLEDNGEYVGIFNFRHYLNDFLKAGPGHIGYAISPKFRGLGYAKKGLKLLLEKVSIKEDEFYLSCNRDNVASLKVQLALGAYIHHEDDSHYYTRIKKTLYELYPSSRTHK